MIQKYIIHTLEFAISPGNCICSYLAIKDCTCFFRSQVGFLREMTWLSTGDDLVLTWFSPRDDLVSTWFYLKDDLVSTCFSLRDDLASTWFSLRDDLVSTWFSLRDGLASTRFSLRDDLVSTWFSPRDDLVSTWSTTLSLGGISISTGPRRSRPFCHRPLADPLRILTQYFQYLLA